MIKSWETSTSSVQPDEDWEEGVGVNTQAPKGLRPGKKDRLRRSFITLWRPVGDSNPCTDRERVVS